MPTIRKLGASTLVALVLVCQPALAFGQTTGECRETEAILQEMRRASDRMHDLEERLIRQGCTDSIVVIKGGQRDICGALSAEYTEIERTITLLDGELRFASTKGPVKGRQAPDGPTACGLSPVAIQAPPRHGHSQFRYEVGRGSVIELRPRPASAPPVGSSLQENAPTEPLEKEPAEMTAAASELPGESMDLDDRPDRKNVRVVGPKFLPDRSEAIDLRSPDRTLFP